MGKPRRDLTEIRFGRLVAKVDVGPGIGGTRLWKCSCDCGGSVTARSGDLTVGNTKSCGCFVASGDHKRRHGHASATHKSRVYVVWLNMRQRCNNEDKPQFKDWGGRGITYDPRWEVFENFLADMGEPPAGMSLDRIDNDGNYTKENCRWASAREQRLNSKRVHMLTWNGKTLCVRDWERELGLKPTTLTMRLKRGLPMDQAMSPSRLPRSSPPSMARRQ